MKRTLLVIALVIGCGAGAVQAQVPVADFFSTNSRLDGQPLPAGTTLEAYDTDGIRCGFATANADGSFLIHVYGNDPMTPATDEGAREGEMLTWRIDGHDVETQEATWIANLVGMFADLRWENGAAKQFKLDVRTTAAAPASWTAVKEQYRP
jgi:hypothetical protein